jgi:hypothetical protein
VRFDVLRDGARLVLDAVLTQRSAD